MECFLLKHASLAKCRILHKLVIQYLNYKVIILDQFLGLVPTFYSIPGALEQTIKMNPTETQRLDIRVLKIIAVNYAM